MYESVMDLAFYVRHEEESTATDHEILKSLFRRLSMLMDDGGFETTEYVLEDTETIKENE